MSGRHTPERDGARRIRDMDETTESLRKRFRAGDEAAFQELLDRYRGGLRARLARRIPASLQRRIAPSDVIQETSILAFARREDFEDRGDGSFGAWLRAIADRKLKEEVRRHGGASKRSAAREVTRGARPDTAYFCGDQRTPSAVVSLSEEASRVRSAMSQLPPDYQRVISLVLEHGLPLREVAEQMGRSREAAKKLYGRAVVRLRELVDELAGGA